MTEVLRRMPEVGDVVVRIADSDLEFEKGAKYKVVNVDHEGDAEVYDRHGNLTAIVDYELPRFAMEEAFVADFGYIEVHENFDADDSELMTIEITVERKMYDYLVKLEEQHNKASQAKIINAEIERLKEQLKKL